MNGLFSGGIAELSDCYAIMEIIKGGIYESLQL